MLQQLAQRGRLLHRPAAKALVACGPRVGAVNSVLASRTASARLLADMAVLYGAAVPDHVARIVAQARCSGQGRWGAWRGMA